jgi:integrase
VLRGIRCTLGAAKAGKAPATADVLITMLALCPDTLAGKRDRALLALGFAGAFHRSELVALQVADLEEVADGYRVTRCWGGTNCNASGQANVSRRKSPRLPLARRPAQRPFAVADAASQEPCLSRCFPYRRQMFRNPARWSPDSS